MSEPTLTDIAQQLQELKKQFSQFRLTTDLEFQEVKRDLEEVKQRVEKLDARLFDLSMLVVSNSSAALWGVGTVLLSTAIAFVVARISGGNL